MLCKFRSAAKMLGISVATLERFVAEFPTFPAVIQPAGPKGARLFVVSELEAWALGQRKGVQSEQPAPAAKRCKSAAAATA